MSKLFDLTIYLSAVSWAYFDTFIGIIPNQSWFVRCVCCVPSGGFPNFAMFLFGGQHGCRFWPRWLVSFHPLEHPEARYLVYLACSFAALVVLSARLIAPRNALKARGVADFPMRSLGEKPILQIELARN